MRLKAALGVPCRQGSSMEGGLFSAVLEGSLSSSLTQHEPTLKHVTFSPKRMCFCLMYLLKKILRSVVLALVSSSEMPGLIGSVPFKPQLSAT